VGIRENIAWLREFYARFDEDVKLLYSLETTWLPCIKCLDGHCCGRNSYVSLRRQTNPFAVEDWQFMLEYVRDNFSPEDKKQLAKNIVSSRSACIFLFKNRCSVHPNRPWGSRIHPYTICLSKTSDLLPAGKIALPSCPALASAFGLKVDERVIQAPEVIEKHPVGRLVKVKLKKHKPVWLLDASDYLGEYEKYVQQRNPVTAEDIERLLKLAESVGGEFGGLLRVYLEQVLGLRRNLRLLPR
jgi:Fe-S-cluster containining protein